ncbi:hypothetical protein ACFRMQ_08070 [Kitasatospora sp. NPDC056783]|uniref:hypothetical protein n=1 Tax=Kitasatospora sp. NPDC056783 TaxID=3345943 RepID=UPI0036A47926
MAEADGGRRGPADGPADGAGTAGGRAPEPSGIPESPDPSDLVALSAEERALRELMHGAVSGIQPSVGGLPRIRRAVPRRRAVRRGAWTGAAALAFVVAIGLPVLREGEHLGLSGGPGSADAKSPAASSPTGSAGTDGAGTASHTGPSGSGGATPPGTASASHVPGGSATRTDGGVAPTGSSSAGGIVPLCGRTDLGEGAAQVGAADGAGRIYGSFTVYNVSGRSCRLGGPGSVEVTAVSGGDRGRVRTADHVPGDPAVGLPAMDAEPPVLAPRAGYRVPFAWVPDQACTGSGTVTSPSNGVNRARLRSDVPTTESGAPDSGASGGPSSNPQASSSPSAGPSTDPSPTASPSGNQPTVPPAATLAHTPAPGSPAVATATVPVPCSGTVYRGGVQGLDGPAPQPSGSPTAG